MFFLAGALALLTPFSSPAAAASFESSLQAGLASIRDNAVAARREMALRAEDLAARLVNAPVRRTSPEVAACLRDLNCRTPFVVAHRTSGFDAPENSVGGVAAAIKAAIPIIETDIRLAKDGTWVMLHDPNLDRTTGLKGPVARKTWTELKVARLKDGEPMPRFFDLYAASRGRAVLVLDLKVDLAEAVADWIARNGSFDDLIFFASDAKTLASCLRARSRHPEMMVMARVEQGLSWQDALAAYGGNLPLIVHPNFPAPDLADRLRARGSKMYTTVVGHDRVPGWRNDVARLLLRRGSALIDTDHPSWLESVFERFGGWALAGRQQKRFAPVAQLVRAPRS